MAAHDQVRGVTADVARLSIELAGLDKLLRQGMAPTIHSLEEVSYWPIPVSMICDLAGANRVAMDKPTAQRVAAQFWLNRVLKYGDAKAVFNIDESQLVRHLEAYREKLNTTWQSALVTIELKTGLVALFDMTARPALTGGDKRVTWRLFLTTPEHVEEYRRYGELDQRDGTIDLLAHKETEGHLVTPEKLDAHPATIAVMMLWNLISPTVQPGSVKDTLPEGLDRQAILDAYVDLEEAYNRMAAVDMGRLPSEFNVRIEVTNWRQ